MIDRYTVFNFLTEKDNEFLLASRAVFKTYETALTKIYFKIGTAMK